jgi:hypothetical protein
MKKIIILAFLTWTFATAAGAAEGGAAVDQTVRLGVDVDYNLVAMDQVNKQLNKGVKVTNLNSGISGMLDLDVAVAPFLTLGARAGYLNCAAASATYDYLVYNQTTTLNTTLIPLEVGVGTNFAIPATPISIMAGVYGGYGFASASLKEDFNALGQTASVTEPYTGGGFVGDLAAAINLQLFSALSLNINGGYRLAKISQMTLTQDVNYNGIPYVSIPVGSKGDVLKDSDNNAMVFDYSGFHAGAGLSLGF